MYPLSNSEGLQLLTLIPPVEMLLLLDWDTGVLTATSATCTHSSCCTSAPPSWLPILPQLHTEGTGTHFLLALRHPHGSKPDCKWVCIYTPPDLPNGDPPSPACLFSVPDPLQVEKLIFPALFSSNFCGHSSHFLQKGIAPSSWKN